MKKINGNTVALLKIIKNFMREVHILRLMGNKFDEIVLGLAHVLLGHIQFAGNLPKLEKELKQFIVEGFDYFDVSTEELTQALKTFRHRELKKRVKNVAS